jgi:hypothetical protein
MSYLDANELIFNNDIKNGIHTGGFSVNSIMMKEGISPIMTINNNNIQTGGTQQVSDLFNNLVVPNWALSYHNKMFGGEYIDIFENDDEDNIINDDLHDKLIDLVRKQDEQQDKHDKQNKKKNTKKMQNKKGGTKKKKNI